MSNWELEVKNKVKKCVNPCKKKLENEWTGPNNVTENSLNHICKQANKSKYQYKKQPATCVLDLSRII